MSVEVVEARLRSQEYRLRVFGAGKGDLGLRSETILYA